MLRHVRDNAEASVSSILIGTLLIPAGTLSLTVDEESLRGYFIYAISCFHACRMTGRHPTRTENRRRA